MDDDDACDDHYDDHDEDGEHDEEHLVVSKESLDEAVPRPLQSVRMFTRHYLVLLAIRPQMRLFNIEAVFLLLQLLNWIQIPEPSQ